MSDSLLNGSVWYWRQGVREAPIHGDACWSRELYMPAGSQDRAENIIKELKEKGIKAESKVTHSPYDVVPSGSLIVFAAKSLEIEVASEKENVEKLKSYILANGGRIDENPGALSGIKGFVQKLFGRG